MHVLLTVVAAFLLHGVASSNVTLSPAATAVPGSNLLPEERSQLTDQVIENVASELTQQLGNPSFADLFSFGTNASVSKFSTSRCKTYDGDSLWPNASLWNLFNDVLGEALLEVLTRRSYFIHASKFLMQILGPAHCLTMLHKLEQL